MNDLEIDEVIAEHYLRTGDYVGYLREFQKLEKRRMLAPDELLPFNSVDAGGGGGGGAAFPTVLPVARTPKPAQTAAANAPKRPETRPDSLGENKWLWLGLIALAILLLKKD